MPSRELPQTSLEVSVRHTGARLLRRMCRCRMDQEFWPEDGFCISCWICNAPPWRIARLRLPTERLTRVQALDMPTFAPLM